MSIFKRSGSDVYWFNSWFNGRHIFKKYEVSEADCGYGTHHLEGIIENQGR
jgi:hypothetical protein